MCYFNNIKHIFSYVLNCVFNIFYPLFKVYKCIKYELKYIEKGVLCIDKYNVIVYFVLHAYVYVEKLIEHIIIITIIIVIGI